MKQKLRSRLLAICTALSCGCVMLLSSGVINTESYAATDTGEVSVIFTHDMHSHMDADRVSKDGKAVETGGFGKLKTAMDKVRSCLLYTSNGDYRCDWGFRLADRDFPRSNCDPHADRIQVCM